jgi:hypothetical protein
MPEINHLDGDISNNHYSNLEWVDHKSQMQHASKMGLLGGKYVQLSKEQVIKIRSEYLCGNISHRKLAEEYGVCKSTITNILMNKAWMGI